MMRILSILGLLSAFLLIRLAEHLVGADSIGVVGYQFLKENGTAGFFNLTTILGEMIVFLFYWFKFNEWAGPGVAPKGFRPRPARHFTTWLRFLGWNTFYGLLMVGAYTVIIFFPEQISRILDSFAATSNTLKAPIPALSEAQRVFNLFPVNNPLSATGLAPYAVMITTVVWAGMRPFSEFERRFRLRLQEHAAIPIEAKNLIETFEQEMDSFVPEQKTISDVLKEQYGHLNQKADFYDPGDNLWFLMARTAYLYHLLLKYNREPVFSKLAERYEDEFKDLKEKIMKVYGLAAQRINDIQRISNDVRIGQTDALSAAKTKVIHKKIQPDTLKDAEQFLAEQLEPATKFEKTYFRKQEKYLKSAIKKTSEEIIQLIVCSVLAVGRSRQQCRYLLEAFGLKQQNTIPNQLDSVVVTWIAGGALSIAFVCSLVYYYAQKSFGTGDLGIIPTDVNGVLYWAVASCLLHLFAIVGGFFCQRGLESGRERLQLGGIKENPLSFRAQVAEALCSASFGFSLSIFLLGSLMAFHGKFAKLYEFWWWAFVPTVTAFFAAFYTQRVKRTKRQMKCLIWTQGMVTGFVSFVVFFLLHSDNLSKTWSFGCYATITSIILGVALSKILQKWVEGMEKQAGRIGLPDQRKEERQRPLFKRAKWRSTEGEEIAARVVNISSSGVELETKTPLSLATEGVVKITGKEEQRARVVRNTNHDAHHIYVEFLEAAA